MDVNPSGDVLTAALPLKERGTLSVLCVCRYVAASSDPEPVSSTILHAACRCEFLCPMSVLGLFLQADGSVKLRVLASLHC